MHHLKSQMASAVMTYADFNIKLKKVGTTQSQENLRVKFNRGNFGAQLFLVMGKSEISLKDLENIIYPTKY